jgi:hypothetical protein
VKEAISIEIADIANGGFRPVGRTAFVCLVSVLEILERRRGREPV